MKESQIKEHAIRNFEKELGQFQVNSDKKEWAKVSPEDVYNLLKEIPGFEVNMPQGAFYFFPNVKHYLGKSFQDTKINSINDLCMFLLEDAQVSLVTGEAFGDPECLRLSYAASEEDLKLAISKMKTSLAKLA